MDAPSRPAGDPVPDVGVEVPSADLLDSREAGPSALRGGALRTGAYVAGIVLSLLSTPLLIRHLGVEDFGRFATVTSLMLLVAGMTELGLSAIALREYATRDGADRDRAMRALLGLRLILTLAGSALAIGFAAVSEADPVLVLGTTVAAVGVAAQVAQSMYATGLQAQLRFGWVSVFEVGRNAIATVLIVVLVVAGAGLLPFFAAQAVAGAVAMIGTAIVARRALPLLPAFHPSAWLPFVREALPFAGAVALQVAYFRIGLIGMSVLSSARETGYFATSFRILEVIVSVPVLAIGAAFPILARSAQGDADRFDQAMRRILELGLIVGVWVVLCLTVGAQVAIDVIAGDESQPSVEILRIQAVAAGATFIAAACTYALLSLHRHRTLMLLMLAPLSVVLVGTIALAPTYGGVGTAWATAAAELALVTAGLWALHRARPGVVGGLRRAPLVLLAGALAAAVVLIPGLPALVDVLLAAALYPLLLRVLGLFPPELSHALRGRR